MAVSFITSLKLDILAAHLAARFLSIPLDFVVPLSTPLGKALIEFLLVHIFAVATPVKNLEPRSHEVAPRKQKRGKNRIKKNQIMN